MNPALAFTTNHFKKLQTIFLEGLGHCKQCIGFGVDGFDAKIIDAEKDDSIIDIILTWGVGMPY